MPTGVPERPYQAPGLRATVRARTPGVVCVAVVGEIDMSTAPVVSAAISAALDAHPDRVDLDLSGVTFLDCSAVRVLLSARRSAAPAGLRVVAESGAVRHVLDLLELRAVLDGAADR